jgi:transcriptional regulator with XRE-family HTH domain
MDPAALMPLTKAIPKHVKFPNRLRELRVAKGLGQAKLGELVGLTAAAVNRHERGNRSLDGMAIDRYADVLGVSPYELFVRADHEIRYDTDPDDSVESFLNERDRIFFGVLKAEREV